MRDNGMEQDEFIETQSGMYPLYHVKGKDNSGEYRDWICVNVSVIQRTMSTKTFLRRKEVNPIMELKRREIDDPVRSQIAINLEAAIAKRVKRGQKTEFLLEIAKDYGYPDVRSLQNAMNVANPRSLTAEDILYFETQKGIHRDEILGTSIERKGLSNIRGFQRIYKKIKDDPELRNSVNGVLSAFNEALNDCSGLEAERRCNAIKAKIDTMNWT